MVDSATRPAGTLRALPDPPVGIASLTRREREVLSLIAAGWSNEGIRDALVVSRKTVESHVHSIFLKLALPRGADMHARVLATRVWLQADPALPAADALRPARGLSARAPRARTPRSAPPERTLHAA